MKYRPGRRTRRVVLGAAVVLALAGVNGPALYGIASARYHTYKINQSEYTARNGHWDLLDVPEEYRINTIHAALLHTGKVLLVAGSGNDAKMFRAKTFRTVLWDPEKNTFKNIPTPKDLFCAGHTQLPDGRLLVAGGTQRYEKLEGDVDKAGGLMIVKNEDPDKPRTFPAGTLFTGKKNGKTFESKDPLLVKRAKKTVDPVTGEVTVTASEARVYVEAREKGRRYSTGDTDNYRIRGLEGADARNFYGIANKLSFDKKDFQGIRDAYEFDPVAERYITVDPMREARWYPTLTTLEDGRVLSVSGLDEIGQVVPGKNEIYDPETKKWSPGPRRFFPTYPALFLTDRGRIFYTGSNAGYGPADKGRTPGIWDLKDNTFREVPGISDPGVLETSMSVLLPPAQDQRFMVLGGGGVGESRRSTGRTRLVDLTEDDPRFEDGAPLSEGTRYPGGSILPDDTVFVSGGSGDYRGRSGSNILKARLYDPRSDSFRRVADPAVGRNYHSGTLLLPDGRVMIFGSDSLFSDDANTRPGVFEKRIEIYTPPYLYQGGGRPQLGPGPKRIERGGSATYAVKGASRIGTARLMRPSAVTHVTDVDQRSIALDVRRGDGKVTVKVPGNRSLVPSGWYMLFVNDDEGVPSKAVWVEVP